MAADADRAADDNSGFEAEVGIGFESVFGRDAALTCGDPGRRGGVAVRPDGAGEDDGFIECGCGKK